MISAQSVSLTDKLRERLTVSSASKTEVLQRRLSVDQESMINFEAKFDRLFAPISRID